MTKACPTFLVEAPLLSMFNPWPAICLSPTLIHAVDLLYASSAPVVLPQHCTHRLFTKASLLLVLTCQNLVRKLEFSKKLLSNHLISHTKYILRQINIRNIYYLFIVYPISKHLNIFLGIMTDGLINLSLGFFISIYFCQLIYIILMFYSTSDV